MEINQQNLNLLNDENKFKFAYLCVKNVFPKAKESIYKNYKDSAEHRPIQVVNLVEKWLNNPNDVNIQIIKKAVSVAKAASESQTALVTFMVSEIAWSLARLVKNAIEDIEWVSRSGPYVAWVTNEGNNESKSEELRWQEKLLDKIVLEQFKNMDDNEIIQIIRQQELDTKQQMTLNSILELSNKEHLADYLTSHFSGWQFENLKKTIKEEIVKLLKEKH